MFALMMAAFTLTGCEDVPAPYDIPEGGVGGGGETPLPEGTYLEADFTTSLGKFKSESAEGDGSIKWDINYSSACITGYADWDGSGTKTNKAGVTFLVSPEVDLTKATEAYVELNHAMRYENGDINTNNSLLITDNYTGDVKTTAWTQIKYPTTGLNGAQFDFVTSKANIPAEFMGKKVVVALRHTCAAKSSTWEVKKLSVLAGKVDETTPDTPGAGEAKGTGTKADPFNVAGANKYIKDGGDATVEVYVKGKVSELKEYRETFGSISYYISEDGSKTDQFFVYGGNNLGNTKFKSIDELKIGDEVVICGKLKNFNNVYEFDSRNYIVSLNGKTSGEEKPDTPDTPTGKNLLTNGDCEKWNGTAPEYWKSASKAGNANLTQSTDAHSGSYSISVGFNKDQNKRIAYKEIKLKPGKYVFSFYAKATTADKSQCRPGYAIVKEDGSIDPSSGYKYATGYTALNNTTWTLVSNEFTLTETTTICLIMMNPKTSKYATAQNILFDDASLVTSDGGFAE